METEHAFLPAIKKIAVALLFTAVLSVGAGLRLSHLDIANRSPDELVYTSQARVIAHAPVDGVRRLVREYNAEPRMWIYPPPTRIGYDYLLAAVMKFSRITDQRAGSFLSAACSIASLFILLALGLRFFGKRVALAALLFMSVSPMDLAIARRCWQDSVLAMFGLIAIYFCFEICRNHKKKLLYLPFYLAGGFCLLIKESGFVIFSLCVLWLAMAVFFKERSFKRLLLIIGFGALTAISISAAWIAIVGDPGAFVEVFRHIKEAMPTNHYAVEYQTGPWYNMPRGLWILTPAGTILCAIGIICILAGGASARELACSSLRETSLYAAKGMALFILSFMAITIAAPYCQNIRYLSVIYAPFYMMCGAGLVCAATMITALTKDAYPVVVVLLAAFFITAAVNDYSTFQRIFIHNGAKDISIRLLILSS